MAEGILKFELPEEKEDFEVAVHATSIFLLLCDIEQVLRSEVKYKDNKQAEDVREMIYDKMVEHNLSLDMMS